jgi:hypothetical protein
MNGAVTRYVAGLISIARHSLLSGLVCALGGCITDSGQILNPPPPYMLLPADEMMSCDAIAASFHFAARRAARLEYWLSVGHLQGYGFDEFPHDAPRELVDERRRLDALTDLQRYRGCIVLEPGPAVVYERTKLEGSMRGPQPPVVLKSRG